MKIAVFTDVFLDVPGGIPSSILAQKRSLEKLGHEVIVFAPGFSGQGLFGKSFFGKDFFSRHNSLAGFSKAEQETIVLVPTHPLIRPNGAPLSKRPQLVEKAVLKKFPKFDFDIVHVHYEASCSITGSKLARRFSRPLVQTMHGREDMAVQINIPFGLKTLVASVLNFLHSKYLPHPKKVKKDDQLAPSLARAKMWELMVNHANFADKVLTPSQHFADKLKHYGVAKDVGVVSNGVDDKMVEELNQRVGRAGGTLVRKVADGDALKIFWNSRLSNEKRIMPFLKALALMKEPFIATFCGDGNAYSKAVKFAKKHNLEKKTRFLGRVSHDEVLDKMIGQHLSVTVSYGFDTQGLTLLEAEATGMPVFFCDPDMQEVVPAGGAVMAAGPEPAQMAKALDNIARNPAQIEKMSREMLRSRSEILQSAQIKKLLAIYQSLLSR